MIKFYYHPSPNPLKVALLLEEIGQPYEVVPVDTKKGEQFSPEFLAINPNAKTPALTDDGAPVFDSNAILLYLAEKHDQFLPENTPAARGQALSWLMFVATGVGPYFGQAVHFVHFAPEKFPYAINRYKLEAKRHLDILDAHLAKNAYMVGSQYTYVDMAVWGWANFFPFIFGEETWTLFPNIKRLLDEVSARPAAGRAQALKAKFSFKAEMDEETRRNLFPQNYSSAA